MSDPNDFFTKSILGETLRLDPVGQPLPEPWSEPNGSPPARHNAQGRQGVAAPLYSPAFAQQHTGIVPLALVDVNGPNKRNSVFSVESTIPATIGQALPAGLGHAGALTNTSVPHAKAQRVKAARKDEDATLHPAALQAYAPLQDAQHEDHPSGDANLVASPGFMISIYALVVITLGLALYVLGRGILF